MPQDIYVEKIHDGVLFERQPFVKKWDFHVRYCLYTVSLILSVYFYDDTWSLPMWPKDVVCMNNVGLNKCAAIDG